VGLAGQPPPILRLSRREEKLVLDCRLRGALQEADAALATCAQPSAIGVDRYACRLRGLKKRDSGLDLKLETEPL
jgi:hypothetical protein